MTNHTRRFAAAAALTLILASTPAIAAPTRDEGGRGDRTFVQIIGRLVQRIFNLIPLDSVIGPIPGPNHP